MLVKKNQIPNSVQISFYSCYQCLRLFPVVANESQSYVVENLEGARFFFVIVGCLVVYHSKVVC